MRGDNILNYLDWILYLLLIIFGSILSITENINFFGIFVLFLSIILILIKYFNIEFNDWIERILNEEKIIEIRERNEDYMKRNANILFTFIVAFQTFELFEDTQFNLIYFLTILILYFIINYRILAFYEKITENMIKEKYK